MSDKQEQHNMYIIVYLWKVFNLDSSGPLLTTLLGLFSSDTGNNQEKQQSRGFFFFFEESIYFSHFLIRPQTKANVLLLY